MKRVTLTLDESTIAWARREAARQNLSLSRYVANLVREQSQASSGYEAAMRRSLALEPVRLRDDDKPYPSREELYDRGRLR